MSVYLIAETNSTNWDIIDKNQRICLYVKQVLEVENWKVSPNQEYSLAIVSEIGRDKLQTKV